MVRSKEGKTVLFPLVVIVILAAIGWYPYNKYKAEELAKLSATIPPMEVLVVTISEQDVPLVKEWVGTTQGDVNANIFAKVSGYLLKKNYTEGSSVQEGDVLFEIDPRPYQAALDQAQGVLEKAIANQKKSKADVRRYGSLVREGAVSKKEYGDAVRTNEMNKASINSAQASLDQAKLNLDWTKVTAPISGVSGLAIAQVGDLIDPSKKLTTISLTDPMKVTFAISENEYIWHQKMEMEKETISPDDEVAKNIGADAENFEMTESDISIVLNDGSTYPEKGKFAFTDRQVDSSTGTMTVQVTVPNPNGFLRPGQYAKVLIKMGVFKNALVIPRKAIIETQGIPQVAVVNKDNKIEMRSIKTGYIFGNDRIVESGLKDGDVVVVEGFLKVKEGSVVNPKRK